MDSYHPNANLQPYFNRCNELSVTDGCVLWGSHVIVPPPGRDIILKQLHDTHPGISRMKRLVRSYVWWPGIDNAAVHECTICQDN